MKKLYKFSLAALFLVVGLQSAHALTPRIVFEKYLWADGVDPDARYLDQLMVKFYDEDMVRLRNGQFTSLNGSRTLSYTKDFLARHPEIHPDVIIKSETEEQHLARLARIEQKSGKDLVDMFSFYCFRLPEGAADPKALLADILGAPEVETAYYEPIPKDFNCQDLGSPTPNWFASQNHYDAAPLGVDLLYVRSEFGADIADGVSSTWTGVFERGADVGHEDYTDCAIQTGGSGDSDNDHGTAVAGIVGACDDNGVGMIGFLADHTTRVFQRNSPNYGSTADVYNYANTLLLAGEVTTNSWGYTCSPCPAGQSCPCNPDQNGSVPIEYNAAVKAEVDAGTADGIIYCLSAGNGCVNLDDPIFGSAFDFATGSIYVAAVNSTGDHDASCFTDWGSRVTSCAWGDGVYTLGYGGLFMGTGQNEWYTAGFNGTSSAGPIVAGCAGVLNNLYRSINGGANISPATMRGWLDNGGTPPGNVTPGNVGNMPNLFAITAPDLNADQRTGWTNVIVPRNSGNADGSNAVLPGTLVSSPDTTFWNSSIENSSQFGTASPAKWRLHCDDVSQGSYYVASGSLGPLGRTYYTNDYAFIRGGRHTSRCESDYLDEVNEFYEANNSGSQQNWVEQHVWNPRVIVGNTVYGFTAPPIDVVSYQLPDFPYENCDGYRGSNFAADGYWDIIACMAAASPADYDMYAYSEAITSTNGFDTYEESSFFGGTSVDFVGVNNNEVAGGNATVLLAAVNNYNDATEDYRVEGQSSVYLGTPTYPRTSSGAQTFTGSEIFDSWEFYVNELVPYNIEIDATSGNANVVITVFGPSNIYFGRDDEIIQRNSAGAGGDEMISCWTPPSTGFYCIVVHKSSAADWGETLDYTMYVGKAGYDLTHNLNTGWSHELVIRQATGSTPAVLPATLTGNQTINYFNAGYINQGCGTSPGSLLNDAFLIDGPTVWTTGNWSAHAPGTTTQWLNQGPVFVWGGRHQAGDIIDVNAEGNEYNVDNNRHDEQFVWTPFAMNNQQPYLTATFAPNFRDLNSSEFFTYANQDGWRWTGTADWCGSAVCPVDPDDGLNARLFSPSTGSENGFDVPLAFSTIIADGIVEFVVENGNTNGAQTFDFGVTNEWSYPSTPSQGAYRTYQCNRIQNLADNTSNGPFTLSNNHLIHVYDLNLTNGVPKRIILDNQSGVDLGLAIFDANDAYGSRQNNGTIVNSNGDGGDESIVFNPTSTGDHGIVVFKNDNTDIGSAPYRLIVGDRIPATPLHLVIQTLNSQTNPIQMRAHWDSVTTDVNGAPMNVDQYQVFYTLDPNLVGFPAGWTPYLTTTQATLNFNVAVTAGYFRMVVVAQDSDGLILAHSPLPDGMDLAGTRLDVDPSRMAPGDRNMPVLGETVIPNSRE